VRAAPAVSCAMCTRKCAHEHTGPAESIRPSLRSGFTVYFALSPVSRALLPPSLRGCHHPRNLAPASGARTTRLRRTRWRRSSAQLIAQPTPSRPPQPAPMFVTTADAPLAGQDGGSCRGDLGSGRSGLFLRARLDRANHVEVVTENRTIAHAGSPSVGALAAANPRSARDHCALNSPDLTNSTGFPAASASQIDLT
jgi:hypothetical protein